MKRVPLLSLFFLLLITSPALALNVSMTTTVDGGDTPMVKGRTNLPDGMKLMVAVSRNGDAFIDKKSATVDDGLFRAGPFTRHGASLIPGSYNILINSADLANQPKVVLYNIGKNGEMLAGPHIKKSGLGGNIIEYRATFKVAGVSTPRNEKIHKVEKADANNGFSMDGFSLSNLFDRPNGDLEKFQMKGKIGVGLEASMVNLGMAPTVEYWFTDNIDLLAHYSIFGDWKTLGMRGEYLLDKPFTLAGFYKAKPYVGIGYSTIEVKSPPPGVTQEGSGFDLHAGVLTSGQHIVENLMVRLEFCYSTAKIETKADANGVEVSREDADFSGFSVGAGLYYYF